MCDLTNVPCHKWKRSRFVLKSSVGKPPSDSRGAQSPKSMPFPAEAASPGLQSCPGHQTGASFGCFFISSLLLKSMAKAPLGLSVSGAVMQTHELCSRLLCLWLWLWPRLENPFWPLGPKAKDSPSLFIISLAVIILPLQM